LQTEQEGELKVTDRAKGDGPFSERWRTFRRAFREFFYGMTVHGLAVETRHVRGELDHLFMLILFGDLVGIPILPPYYSLRFLPHILPSVQRWKRSVLREKDITDLARVDL
jgi:hypothetical protein